jgi:hypothetical protein
LSDPGNVTLWCNMFIYYWETCIKNSQISIQERIKYKVYMQIIYWGRLALSGKLSLGGLFCDITKAFDSMNHIVLLSKLEFCGTV